MYFDAVAFFIHPPACGWSYHAFNKPIMIVTPNRLRSLFGLLIFCCGQFLYADPPDTMTVHYYLRDTFCANQSLFVVNQIFDKFNPSGTVRLIAAAVDGSDSLIHVELVYREPSVVLLEQDLCAGDTLWVNNQPYYAGFYLGEETMEGGAANGCDSIITVRLNIVQPPVRTLNDTLCPGDFQMVNGQRYDRDHPAGLEILAAAAQNGCDSLVMIDLTFKDLQISLGADRAIISGDTICLQPTLNFTPESLSWLPALDCTDPDCSSNCIQPITGTTYQVMATDSSGCLLSDDLRITVSNQNRVYAPNVFQPEATEPNNRFFISTDAGVQVLRRLFITDRWGEILFDRQDVPPNQADAGWDGTWRGKPVSPGAYLFWTELERLDGSRFKLAGTVTVLR